MSDSLWPSTPASPVLHHLPEFAQIHVHWVGDAIQPAHALYKHSLKHSYYNSFFPVVHKMLKIIRKAGISVALAPSILFNHVASLCLSRTLVRYSLAGPRGLRDKTEVFHFHQGACDTLRNTGWEICKCLRNPYEEAPTTQKSKSLQALQVSSRREARWNYGGS